MPRHLLRVEDLHAADEVALALGDRLLGRPPVHGRDVVAVALRGRHLELARRTLGVVAGPEHPAVGDLLAGVAEIPVERRRQDLEALRHRARLRVDLHGRDDALVVARVLVDRNRPSLRDRDREARRHHRVLGVRRDERRAVVPRDVRHRPEDLLRLEVLEVDAGDAAVHLVHEEPAPVVVAVRLRERRMVHVAPREAAQHRLRLVVEPVARGGVRRIDRNRREVAHGRDAVDVDLPRVPAGGEHVELVEIPRCHVGLHRPDRLVRGRRGPFLRALRRRGRAPPGEETGRRDRDDRSPAHPLLPCRFHSRSSLRRMG